MRTAAARPARPARALCAGLALGLAACGGLPLADYGGSAALPERVELTVVPFHAQESKQCGPAALAMLLAASGVSRSPDELKDAVYLPQREGSLQAELLAATRRSGLLPYVLDAQPDALLRELAAGRPVLVLQNLGFSVAPRWHYAVVVGYDRPAQKIILRSGSEARLVLGSADFDRAWASAGRWAFVAVPPDQPPASATADRLAAAAAALEGVAPVGAGRAYGAVLERWPANLVARIGVGNAAHRRHDLATAEAAYRRAIAAHPDAADAWNNLAQTLREAGRRGEALAAARRAVALDGARRKTHAATLAAIEDGAPP